MKDNKKQLTRDGIVFAEICNADGMRIDWKCLGKASRVLK